MMALNTDRLRRKLWTIAAAIWLTAAAISIAGMLALSSLSHAEPDTVYADDFEFHCGFGVDSPRQMVGVVRIPGQFPRVVTLDAWDALFGGDFPAIENGRVYLTTHTGQYISLPFTTRRLHPLDFGGGIVNVQNPAASPNVRVEYSISDRCGDFDAAGPWLAANPFCVKDLGTKQRFGWTTALPPNPFACTLQKGGVSDPNQVWYLNARVTRCLGFEGDTMPPQCVLYLLNAD